MCVCVGECVLALKSMIGSTAQQFHTYLSHRGEETGNIRGSMRVRVPSERMGTRERLYGTESVCVCVDIMSPTYSFSLYLFYPFIVVICLSFLSEWISVDKDETGGPKGRTLPPRAGHDYVK